MSASLPLLLALSSALTSAPAKADPGISSVDDGIVIRPDTYVVDTRFTTGTAENFIELYVDPEAIKGSLRPAAPPQAPTGPKGVLTTAPSFPPTGTLPLVNERLSKTVVTVAGTKIGLIHSLTEAALHGLASGCYEVNWAFPDGYDFTEQLCTTSSVRPAFPGGPTAAVYLDQGRPGRSEPEWRYGPPDRDKDGLADSDDECPDVAGPEASFGCPDADGDRVPDVRDACPAQMGPARADPLRSDGCPARVFVAAEAIEITEKIFFQTNKSKIKPESFGLLDEIAAILNKHPEIKRVEIGGHTDSTGNDAANLKLSDERSKAVLDYLVKAGVSADRLLARGFGETVAIADNATEEGKAMNRRVEFKILEQDKRMRQVVEAPPAALPAPAPLEAATPAPLPQ